MAAWTPQATISIMAATWRRTASCAMPLNTTGWCIPAECSTTSCRLHHGILPASDCASSWPPGAGHAQTIPSTTLLQVLLINVKLAHFVKSYPPTQPSSAQPKICSTLERAIWPIFSFRKRWELYSAPRPIRAGDLIHEENHPRVGVLHPTPPRQIQALEQLGDLAWHATGWRRRLQTWRTSWGNTWPFAQSSPFPATTRSKLRDRASRIWSNEVQELLPRLGVLHENGGRLGQWSKGRQHDWAHKPRQLPQHKGQCVHGNTKALRPQHL